MNQSRLVFYHKHRSSGRLRFLKFEFGVCAFEPLPKLSQYIDGTVEIDDSDRIITHPAQLRQSACKRLGLDIESLKIDGDYHALVDTADGVVQVYLVEFTTIDPPFEQAEKIEAEFVDLPQARNLTDVELELLRQAYEHVMTG